MYEMFTDRGRKCLFLAQQEARTLNKAYIGPEHLLLGLCKEGSGIASGILRNFNIDLCTIKKEIEKRTADGLSVVTNVELQQTPILTEIIYASIEQSRQVGHNYIGTEHLLLGLLNVKYGVAYDILRSLCDMAAMEKMIHDYIKPEDPVVLKPPTDILDAGCVRRIEQIMKNNKNETSIMEEIAKIVKERERLISSLKL